MNMQQLQETLRPKINKDLKITITCTPIGFNHFYRMFLDDKRYLELWTDQCISKRIIKRESKRISFR